MTDKIRPELVERMTADGRRGSLSRRDFIRFAVASGMTVAGASALWSTGVAAATPKRGGTFRLGMHDGNTSDTHDPGTYLSFSIIQLAHTHRSYLTMITGARAGARRAHARSRCSRRCASAIPSASTALIPTSSPAAWGSG